MTLYCNLHKYIMIQILCVSVDILYTNLIIPPTDVSNDEITQD